MKSRGSVVGTRMHLPPLLLSRGSNSSAKGGDRLVAIGRGWWRRRMAGSCTRYPPVYSALANTGRETCTCSIGEYIGPRVSRTADVLGNGSCRAPSPDSRACVIYIVLEIEGFGKALDSFEIIIWFDLIILMVNFFWLKLNVSK